jgi:predicted dehydrogenase/threonine dehydrogenase-like Zn-dependent dehydrogenase
VPLPALRPGWVLVANRWSLISAGTERAKVGLAGKNLIEKARARPDLVRKVVDKARVEGVRSAFDTTRERLDALAPLGYSSAGVVIRIGAGVEGISPGDRVACAGGGWANHAEVVAIPRNLLAKLPGGVELEAAAYATVGAIALHAIRQAEATVGERVAVIGLGLVGQLAVRLLTAAGCVPIGIDIDPAAVALAEASGARAFARDDPALEETLRSCTGGIGADAVLVCAATTSADPLALAGRLARERGRLVVVGDVPVEIERAVMYEKELELRLARSYGPGRYDRDYEERGRDIPPGYVRWTEQRNLQAFVDLIASGRLDPRPLTTHRFPIDRADEAYAVLSGEAEGPRAFGILLEYDPATAETAESGEAPARVARPRAASAAPRIGLVGAGAFARATLLPALKAGGATLAAVATGGGLSSADVASRFAFERTATDADEIFADDSIDAVVIATRHSSHASLTAAALRAGKSVFVEKPLALTPEELEEVREALSAGGVLMVGFNRRFAPLVERLLERASRAYHLVVTARVNAGPLPADHWLHDPVEGGGRLVGEGCHFVDLLGHLAGAPFRSVHAVAVEQPDRALECSDELVATFRFSNGSLGTLVYSGAGDPRLPKERIECMGGGLSAVLDDFRRLEVYRGGKREVAKARQDKGHRGQVERFLEAAAGRTAAPAPESYLESSRATLALVESLRTGLPVELP